jgi:hypothetical protein
MEEIMGDWHQSMVEANRNARQIFDWLTSLGYLLTESYVDDGDNARYDGWHLSYRSNGIKGISIRIEYYEMEFVINIKLGSTETSYLFLDHQLFDNASGFQGVMFPSEKLSDIMSRISDDMALHYKDILLGEEEWWSRIEQIIDELKRRAELANEEDSRKNAHKFDRLEAAAAFRVRDYAKVVKLLSSITDCLEPVELKKLDYAKRRCST